MFNKNQRLEQGVLRFSLAFIGGARSCSPLWPMRVRHASFLLLAWTRCARSPNPIPERQRTICSRCSKPDAVCICAALPSEPISTTTNVLVLRHEAERKRKKISTVPLIGLCLAKCKVVERAHEAIPFIHDAIADGYTPIFLFPGKEALLLDEPTEEVGVSRTRRSRAQGVVEEGSQVEGGVGDGGRADGGVVEGGVVEVGGREEGAVEDSIGGSPSPVVLTQSVSDATSHVSHESSDGSAAPNMTERGRDGGRDGGRDRVKSLRGGIKKTRYDKFVRSISRATEVDAGRARFEPPSTYAKYLLFLVDGTWHQAKAMVKAHPELTTMTTQVMSHDSRPPPNPPPPTPPP